MAVQNVSLSVPPSAGHVALLRTTVSGFAARENFTLDQMDDLRMAVEEAAVQLLRRATGAQLVLDMTSFAEHVEIRLSTAVDSSKPVIDPESFSWTILTALADDLHAETDAIHAVITLTKHRTVEEKAPA